MTAYENGNAAVKHLIIEFPKHSRKWYIVFCEQHNKPFYGESPLTGACRNLSSKAQNESGVFETVIKTIGISILNCNAELAAKKIKL
jgi:hypothetical protein